MATATINDKIKPIQEKLVGILTDAGWRDKLKTFVLAGEMEVILQELYLCSQNKQRFVPQVKDIFNCFKECPYEALKVIIVGSEPYDIITPEGGVLATGLAYSHKDVLYNKQSMPVNKYLREAAGDESANSDLIRWANQGVLLLPVSLTRVLNSKRSQALLYQPFISFVLDMLNSVNQGLIFVFIGDQAKEYRDIISQRRHFTFTLPDPSKDWDGPKIFKAIDEILMEYFQTTITW